MGDRRQENKRVKHAQTLFFFQKHRSKCKAEVTGNCKMDPTPELNHRKRVKFHTVIIAIQGI